MGRREAGRRQRLVHLAPVQEEEEDGRLGREGELGRLRGRGPMGRGGVGERPVEKKKMSRGWAKRPDGPAGCWADWAESEENFFSE
jgi:hypothetical protein